MIDRIKQMQSSDVLNIMNQAAASELSPVFTGLALIVFAGGMLGLASLVLVSVVTEPSAFVSISSLYPAGTLNSCTVQL